MAVGAEGHPKFPVSRAAAHERSSEAAERLVLEFHPFLERVFPDLLEAARLQQTTNQRFKIIGLPTNRGHDRDTSA